ncbi:MAG: hypothetical protein ABH821_00075 [archaeon]
MIKKLLIITLIITLMAGMVFAVRTPQNSLPVEKGIVDEVKPGNPVPVDDYIVRLVEGESYDAQNKWEIQFDKEYDSGMSWLQGIKLVNKASWSEEHPLFENQSINFPIKNSGFKASFLFDDFNPNRENRVELGENQIYYRTNSEHHSIFMQKMVLYPYDWDYFFFDNDRELIYYKLTDQNKLTIKAGSPEGQTLAVINFNQNQITQAFSLKGHNDKYYDYRFLAGEYQGEKVIWFVLSEQNINFRGKYVSFKGTDENEDGIIDAEYYVPDETLFGHEPIDHSYVTAKFRVKEIDEGLGDYQIETYIDTANDNLIYTFLNSNLNWPTVDAKYFNFDLNNFYDMQKDSPNNPDYVLSDYGSEIELKENTIEINMPTDFAGRTNHFLEVQCEYNARGWISSTLKSAEGAIEIQNQILDYSKIPACIHYNPSDTIVWEGVIYGLQTKELFDVTADIRFQGIPGVRELATIINESDLKYGTIFTHNGGELQGLPARNADGTPFTDGTNDNIVITFLGKQYLVNQINLDTETPYVQLIALE